MDRVTYQSVLAHEPQHSPGIFIVRSVSDHKFYLVFLCQFSQCLRIILLMFTTGRAFNVYDFYTARINAARIQAAILLNISMRSGLKYRILLSRPLINSPYIIFEPGKRFCIIGFKDGIKRKLPKLIQAIFFDEILENSCCSTRW